ncbi:hypothetical protein BL250_03200 [Erwinia sp. OLTSP20]|uniref:hypothetical protein n=1 Tax=unclassified Erwinia TaxID=2622719 RepID=UPI000C1A0B3D|nr:MULTISPECIES: hypothetical protein [unclassified Erwinia]PIJ51984.1 hypothetical protein BV501_02105 [Erwinia sp. OAMSP11]PIJ74857.1 hypothetical protein BK416_03435 [Erwinia sp. OLSSP12]PIJ76514.1 hypothetical protein BLD47_17900 [Erwinia sp. OLCASP19]PIJ76977.1 hypothetical protein BLD46_18085 [Erwinia sp. OLMTSP26]PIJ88388.1 hypothetical protein BLD49_02625 [Erwinia sp. OLMDSP33]
MDKYLYELPVKLPAKGCTLVYTDNGVVTAAVVKRPDQYVATVDEFFELAKAACFPVEPPAEE